MTADAQLAAALDREAGAVVLWLPVETQHWQVNDWVAAADFARSVGVDTICGKVADGGIRWYGGPQEISAIRDAVHARGCGFIPFTYGYGTRSGQWDITQVDAETAILHELFGVCHLVMTDLETEYNGQTAAAARFAANMAGHGGFLAVTTWADPAQQAWTGVAADLEPVVQAWVPQEYTTWLANQEGEFTDAERVCLQPGIDLTGEFGANDPSAIARAALAHGHRTVYLWQYRVAQQNPALVREIVAEMKPGGAVPPHPAAPAGQTVHTVVSGDTLSGIAARYHTTAWAIWEANPAISGRPGANINRIYPGQKFIIP